MAKDSDPYRLMPANEQRPLDPARTVTVRFDPPVDLPPVIMEIVRVGGALECRRRRPLN